jgi:hypothetical protein
MLRQALRFPTGAVLALALAAPAHAGLGGSSASIDRDRTAFRAGGAARYTADYTVTTLSLGNGATVREYVNAQDTVFAVSWRGASRPDLRQLLGPHFDVMQQEVVRTSGPRIRAPLRVERPDLMVQSGGHPGAFWGRAWVPQSVPAGVAPATLQ